MSTEVALLGPRKIARLGVSTPLVVPSFSSRGFPEVGQMLALLRDDLYGVCLLSAFDVSRQRVQIALPDIADVLVLDSGVYETTAMLVAADLHAPPPSGSNWSRADYRATLATLTEATNALVVSFDHYGPLEQQVALAREDFPRRRVPQPIFWRSLMIPRDCSTSRPCSHTLRSLLTLMSLG